MFFTLRFSFCKKTSMTDTGEEAPSVCKASVIVTNTIFRGGRYNMPPFDQFWVYNDVELSPTILAGLTTDADRRVQALPHPVLTDEDNEGLALEWEKLLAALAADDPVLVCEDYENADDELVPGMPKAEAAATGHLIVHVNVLRTVMLLF